MSIISTFEVENSAALAKRFAALTMGYIDDPDAAKSETARVPLENLFRILEMYRYGAFADENRKGVLALEGIEQWATSPARSESTWHTDIVRALEQSLVTVFGSVTVKDQAIDELEDGLRDLATVGKLPLEREQKVKAFFSNFNTSLA